MSIRIIADGHGDPRPLLVLFNVADHVDQDIAAALPGATILAYATARGDSLDVTLSLARRAGWPGGPLALAGHARGCLDGVRHLIRGGAHPEAAVCIDGFANAHAIPEPWEAEIWAPLIADARAGRRLFVMSCTEQLVAQMGSRDAVISSVDMIRYLTGLPLEQLGGLPLGEETTEGELHIHAYESGIWDRPAYEAQLTEVLPLMLRRYVAPWFARTLAGWRPPSSKPPASAPRQTRTSPPTAAVELEDVSTTPRHSTRPPPSDTVDLQRGDVGSAVRAWQERLHQLGLDAGALDSGFGGVVERATKDFQRSVGLPATGFLDAATRAAAAKATQITTRMPSAVPRADPDAPLRFGAALLEKARGELVAGISEHDPTHADRIRTYLAGTGAVMPVPFGPAMVHRLILETGVKLGVAPPIQGSVSALATRGQLLRAGRWISRQELQREPRRLRPGMIAVYSDPPEHDDEEQIYGDVEVVSEVAPGGSPWRFYAIGVHGGVVTERAHNLAEESFLGAGPLD